MSVPSSGRWVVLMKHLESLVSEWEAMVERVEAERYSTTGETLDQVKRRVAQERPETPHQVLLRKRHEAKAVQVRQVQQIADRVFETRSK